MVAGGVEEGGGEEVSIGEGVSIGCGGGGRRGSALVGQLDTIC